MKKLWLCLLSLGLIIALCACGGKSVPNEKQIKSELPDYMTDLLIFDPFGGSTVESLRVTSLEIEKRKTEDREDTSWCLLQLENDYYSVQRYIICYYTYYDKGGWILDNCDTYREDDVEVRKCPYDEEEVLGILYDSYGEVSIERVYTDEYGDFCFEFDATESYPNVDIVTEGEYILEFYGTEWNGYCDANVEKCWNISGEWDLNSKDKTDNFQFSLNISKFDSEAMTAKGTYSVYYRGLITQQNTYQLENAKRIYEENNCLFIEFESKVIGTPGDMVVFSYESAEAWCFSCGEVHSIFRVS